MTQIQRENVLISSFPTLPKFKVKSLHSSCPINPESEDSRGRERASYGKYWRFLENSDTDGSWGKREKGKQRWILLICFLTTHLERNGAVLVSILSTGRVSCKNPNI